MTYHTPLRYPGGKGRLSNFMHQVIERNGLLGGEYAELYAGGAGIAISLLANRIVSRIHINDLNPSIFSFWHSALYHTDELCHMIATTPVTMEQWYKQKAVQQQELIAPSLELGFSTFFLNRTNRSGIISAGVIGGKEQLGQWKLDARYNREDLIPRIKLIGALRDQISLYNEDAASFITNTLPAICHKALVYLDPPYYKKGKALYQNHYVHDDHAKIANSVAKVTQPWLMTYDNVDEISTLYADYPSSNFSLSYSAHNRYKATELLIWKPDLDLPDQVSPSRAGIQAIA